MTSAPLFRLRVRTESMAYGPHAVSRHGGRVLFVRGAAPDEDVEVEVGEDRGRYAFAGVVSVVRPSPARRSPPCVYLPLCGGCPWQHIDYAAQLEAKRAIVRDHLRRIGGLDVSVAPVLPSPREYGYRHRLKLRVEPRGVAGSVARVGFYAAASHQLVEIERCLLLPPEIAGRIPDAADLANRLRTLLRRAELIDTGAGRIVLCGEAEGPWNTADETRCADWLGEHAEFAGLALAGRGWRRCFGDDSLTIHPEPDLPLRVRAGTFTQVNPAANQLLVRTVLQSLGFFAPPGEPETESQQPCPRVLDLYAGAGNFSVPLARRGARVVAVEQSRQACADGAANAQRLGLARQCRFLPQRAERAAARLVAEGERFDAVLLDPPRSGAAAVLDAVARLGPQRVIYVSCDPATLARDLRRLTDRFHVEAVQPVDLFPHTYHVETVVSLAGK